MRPYRTVDLVISLAGTASAEVIRKISTNQNAVLDTPQCARQRVTKPRNIPDSIVNRAKQFALITLQKIKTIYYFKL